MTTDPHQTPSSETPPQSASAEGSRPLDQHVTSAEQPAAEAERGVGDAAESETPSAAGEGLSSRIRSQLAARQEQAAARAPAPAPASRDKEEDEPRQPPTRPAAERVPVPSRRAPLEAELEAELEAALGNTSLDRLMVGQGPSSEGTVLELESRRRAPVVRIHKDNVFFALGGPNEGVASLRQFAEPPAVGDQMDVIIVAQNPEDNLYEVAIPGAALEVGDWSDLTVGGLVEARVTAANTGGLECTVNNIRAFIPASQVALYRTDDLSEFVGQKLVCVVTEANPNRRNLVLSRRSVLEREREQARQALLDQLEPGQAREGVVRSIRDFGAFVDLGGIDGLIHISQLSWDRVNHPSEVLEEGQRVQVRVEKVDRQTGKISLSLRSLQEQPWTTAPQRFPVGSIVHGVVSRIAKFGAFVKLAPGVEGLVHISELAHHRVNQVSNVLQEGQEIDVKVVSMDAENQRIGLSLKALSAAPAAQEAEQQEEEEEAAAPPVVKKRNVPLKGGLDRGSGGDSLGLKW